MKGVKVYRLFARTGGGQRSGTFTPFTPQVRGLTAAARWLARAALAAVLVLAVLVSAVWARFGPQGLLWTTAWLVLLAGVVTGAVLAWDALEPKPQHEGGPDRG